MKIKKNLKICNDEIASSVGFRIQSDPELNELNKPESEMIYPAQDSVPKPALTLFLTVYLRRFYI